jgi:hypothetical protein
MISVKGHWGLSPHSITSLALVRRVLGTPRPSAFAILRLMANANFVGSCTGSSAGFAPLWASSGHYAPQIIAFRTRKASIVPSASPFSKS